ncbi:hypothetical protein BOX15_Mlig004339g1, partial [Macrostomum lignano]
SMAASKGGVDIAEQEATKDTSVSKPKDTNFYQQRLPAWQPLMTARYAFPMCLLIGAIFIPIGVVLLLSAQSVQEASVDYTKCRDANGLYCAELVAMPGYYGNYRSCVCNVTLTLSQAMSGQVYVYYALTNFYQSHRQYAKSRDDFQLMGERSSGLLSECDPYRQDASTGLWVAPCGAIAKSMFNDSYRLFYHQTAGDPLEVPWTRQGIAWKSDKWYKYGPGANWNVSTKPIGWPASAQQRSPAGYQDDEELMVWMRTAAMPNFRKLHRIVEHGANGTPEAFANGLPAGTYTLQVAYAFPVTGFAGTKSLVLTTGGWMGGRNPILAAAYLAVGCLYTVMGLALALVQLHSSRSAILSVSQPVDDPRSCTASVSNLVENDQLTHRHEKADLEMEEIEQLEDGELATQQQQQQQQPTAKPRSMLQTLTLADY